MKRLLVLVLLIAAFAVGLGLVLRSGGETPPPPGRQPAPGPVAAPAPAEVAAPGPARQEAPTLPRTRAPIAAANAEAPQGVRGVAVDRVGAPVAGVRAYLFESATNDQVERFFNLVRKVPQPPAAETETGADGAFALGLRAATDRRYEVWLLAPGFAELRLGDLTLPAGEWYDLGNVALEQGSRIHGRVLLAGTEYPVPDATVTLESVYPLSDSGIAEVAGGRSCRVAAVDAAGSYAIEHAPRSGAFRLTAVAPGFARVVRNDIQLLSDGPTQVDFELPRGHTIGGWIVGRGGQPVDDAEVEVWPTQAEPAFAGTVEADGRFLVAGLREGTYRLRARAPRFQPLDLPEVQAGATDLRIELEPRAAAGVVVRAPDGRTLRHYQLAVRRYFAEGGGQIAAVRDVPDRTIRLQPHEETAVVDGLDAGSAEEPALFAFHVRAEGYALTLSAPFTPGRGPELPVVEVTMTRGGTIRGQVVDAAGRPVAGARVTTQPAGAVEENPVWRMLASLTPDRITRVTATTAADGTYLLAGLAHGDYQLGVAHEDYCHARRGSIQVAADDDRAIAPVVLQRGTSVRGRTFVDDRPRGQVLVVLTPAAAEAAVDPTARNVDEMLPVRVEAVSDQDGAYELPRRIPPGAYELRAAIQAGTDPQNDVFQLLSQMQRSATTIRVVAGQETLEQEIRLQTR